MGDTSGSPLVLSAGEDIFFSSRIATVARMLGVNLIQVLDAHQLQEALASLVPRLIIVDLNSRACAPLDAIRRIKADARFARTRVVGFLSHVQRELDGEARKAGCDHVMAKSAFSAKLQEILESVK
jgi:CheY-like chemotaxis protein